MKTFQVDAIIRDKRFFARESLRHVELPRCVGHRQEPRVAIEIGDCLPAERHDVAEVGNAVKPQIGENGTGKTPHGRLLA